MSCEHLNFESGQPSKKLCNIFVTFLFFGVHIIGGLLPLSQDLSEFHTIDPCHCENILSLRTDHHENPYAIPLQNRIAAHRPGFAANCSVFL